MGKVHMLEITESDKECEDHLFSRCTGITRTLDMDGAILHNACIVI